MTRLVLLGMVERRRGVVVNISSGACYRPSPSKAVLTFYGQILLTHTLIILDVHVVKCIVILSSYLFVVINACDSFLFFSGLP